MWKLRPPPLSPPQESSDRRSSDLGFDGEQWRMLVMVNSGGSW
ncbi:hypothetical protein HanXRQr2_Chr08g0351181 [Helianthus annuus]|uniref:Uncharacterized protein n=1 Tax=Helianthus annuus TaxID=4232 RepID=A0A9K3NDS0_HELAN|nr:hypothetical protein HanXRQr2_Chr08g0351181 [Helianthus annuus]